MNGPVCMYRIKPMNRFDSRIDLPDCMYKVRNIHESRNGHRQDVRSSASTSPKLDISDQKHSHIPEMALLEARQEDILRQLADLKRQMDGIRNNLSGSTSGQKIAPVKVVESKKKQTCVKRPTNLPKVIINADPSTPPYSLRLAQKLLDGYINVSVVSHVHSSVVRSSEAATNLSTTLENYQSDTKQPTLQIRLIWKNVGSGVELVGSHTPIFGEVNLLRYLARVTHPDLNYELAPNPLEIDALLDTVHLISTAKTKSDRAGLLQTLHQSLGKGEWLAGRSKISVADIAAYSVLKQTCDPKEINVNLTKWLQRCEAL